MPLHQAALQQALTNQQQAYNQYANNTSGYNNALGQLGQASGIFTTTTTGTGLGISGTLSAPGNWYPGAAQQAFATPRYIRPITREVLNKEEFQLPISDIVNLWLARFGSRWVEHDEVFSDDGFFEIAVQRLRNSSKLEQHTLADDGKIVYRIIE